MVSRLAAFLVWAAVAASVVFWATRLLARPAAAPAQTLPVSMEQAARGDILRLFPAPAKSAASIEPALISRFRLIGVIAPRDTDARDGVALIAVDGKPPRAFAVGAPLDHNLVLQSITQRGVSIGPANGPSAGTLSAPSLPPPNTGSLPSPPSLIHTPAHAATGSPPPGMPIQPATLPADAPVPPEQR